MATLSTVYASVLLSSMFLPPVLIKKCGCKWTIVGSMCCYLVFSLGNFHADWYSPSSQPFLVCVPSLGPSCLPILSLTLVVTLSLGSLLGLAFTHTGVIMAPMMIENLMQMILRETQPARDQRFISCTLRF